MALKRFVASLATGTLLVFGGVVATTANASATLTTAAAVTQTNGATCSNTYLDGDARLGPAQLATSGEIGLIVRGYNPLAGLSATQFIATYWNPAANGGSGGWNYPPDNGYVIADGNPVEYTVTLGPGQDIDRFGSEYGAFLAPVGTPYAERALPPMSLDNFDPNFTCNYHEYQVTKSFLVDSGPIAPGFGQRGEGRQYQLNSALVPGAPSPLSVMWLVNNGYLERLN